MNDEIIHILTDPAHWVGEVVMDFTIMLLAVWPIRALVKRHDRKRHGIESSPAHQERRWTAPRQGGYSPPGPGVGNPRPPGGRGAVS